MIDAATQTIDWMLRPDHFNSRSKVLRIDRSNLITLARMLLHPGRTLSSIRDEFSAHIGKPVPRSSFYNFADRFFHVHDYLHREQELPNLVAFTTEEVADRLRIDPSKVDQIIDSGRLRAIIPSGESRVPASALAEFINEG